MQKKLFFHGKNIQNNFLLKFQFAHQKLKVFQQQGFRYKSLPEKDNIILHGFFQSEKFFKNF